MAQANATIASSGGCCGIPRAIAPAGGRGRGRRGSRTPAVPLPGPATGLTVTRLADSGGTVSFAGMPYRAGRGWARQSIDVTIVAGSVQLSQGGKVIGVHPIRHDRSRELGAFANPKGRPRRTGTG